VVVGGASMTTLVALPQPDCNDRTNKEKEAIARGSVLFLVTFPSLAPPPHRVPAVAAVRAAHEDVVAPRARG